MSHTERRYIMSVIHVTKENFEEIKSSDKPVLLDFFAHWCGPCRMLSPVIEEIAEEHPEFVICKVNVDEEGELAREFGIMNIPTMIVFKGGQPVERLSGFRPKSQIVAMLEG